MQAPCLKFWLPVSKSWVPLATRRPLGSSLGHLQNLGGGTWLAILKSRFNQVNNWCMFLTHCRGFFWAASKWLCKFQKPCWKETSAHSVGKNSTSPHIYCLQRSCMSWGCVEIVPLFAVLQFCDYGNCNLPLLWYVILLSFWLKNRVNFANIKSV